MKEYYKGVGDMKDYHLMKKTKDYMARKTPQRKKCTISRKQRTGAKIM